MPQDAPIDVTTVKDPAVPGLSYRFAIYADDHSSPDDADCYDARTTEAWRNFDWQYVGMIVTPIVDHVGDLDDMSDSLWGLEYGRFPLDVNGIRAIKSLDLNELVTNYPGPEMMDQVRFNLKANLGPIVSALTHVIDTMTATETRPA